MSHQPPTFMPTILCHLQLQEIYHCIQHCFLTSYNIACMGRSWKKKVMLFSAKHWAHFVWTLTLKLKVVLSFAFFYGNKCLHEKDENLEEATMDGLLVECRAMKGFVSHASCVLLLFHRGGSSGGYAISEIEAHPDGLPNVFALDGLPNISALAEWQVTGISDLQAVGYTLESLVFPW